MYIQDIVRNAEQDYQNQITRYLYRQVKAPSKDFKPKDKYLRSKNRTVLTNRGNLSNKTADYFVQLLNYG